MKTNRDKYGQYASLFRWAITSIVAAIIVIGHINVVFGGPREESVNASFVGLLALDLVPLAIYALGVRKPSSVYWCGAILVFVTGFAWFYVAVLTDPMKGIYPILGFLLSLGASITAWVKEPSGASQDSHESKRPWWNPTG